jgi:transcriptional regulator with XRE-family HTH domain
MSTATNPGWTVADEIRGWRTKAHLEQTEIAALIGVSQKTISNWETGKTEPTVSQFRRIVNECEHLIHLMGQLMSVPLPLGQLELDLHPARVLTSL